MEAPPAPNAGETERGNWHARMLRKAQTYLE